MGVKFAKLYKVVDNQKTTVVIFIHGLNGDPVDTWKKDRFTKSLPELVESDPLLKEYDVYSFGYKTGFLSKQYDFLQIAKILYAEVQAHLPNREIVFVAHSMGGLVVQQYIVDRYKNYDEENLKLINGAIFLCVPFKGSVFAKYFNFNSQLQSLRQTSEQLKQLEEDWTKYTLRGGSNKLPQNLHYQIPQMVISGAQDGIVTEQSASPLHLDDAEKYSVDVNHTGVCKVDKDSTVFKHIRTFLCSFLEKKNAEFMILGVQGYDKRKIEGEGVMLDWTSHFNYSPRVLPTSESWVNKLIPELKYAAKTWSENWEAKNKKVRISGKLPLTAGVLIGNHFSRTKGAIIEVDHYGEMWNSEKMDSLYKVHPKYCPGNDSESVRAILVVSVSKNIQSEVEQHLQKTETKYQMLVNILPEKDPSSTCIENAEQAVAYSAKVKEIAEGLKDQGIDEIYMFINAPFSLALFVGHWLTAMCPIQTFDYVMPGYEESCKL